MQRASDRWVSIALSVLLHGALLAALVYGWMMFRRPPPKPTLAIEATVVDARALRGAVRPPPEPPPPAAPEPSPPPPPTPPPPQEPLVPQPPTLYSHVLGCVLHSYTLLTATQCARHTH